MWAKLISHTFPDRPDWILVRDTVLLGKIYRVIPRIPLFLEGNVINLETGEQRKITTVLVEDAQEWGLMPTCVFEFVDEHGKSLNGVN